MMSSTLKKDRGYPFRKTIYLKTIYKILIPRILLQGGYFQAISPSSVSNNSEESALYKYIHTRKRFTIHFYKILKPQMNTNKLV